MDIFLLFTLHLKVPLINIVIINLIYIYDEIPILRIRI